MICNPFATTNMKYLLPTLFLFSFFCGCSSNGIDDASKRNKNWCWFVNKETGKGEWVPIKDETNLPDGEYSLFFSNGSIRQKGKLKDKKDCDTTFSSLLKAEEIKIKSSNVMR
jgi:hypothetical protein